MDTHPSTTRPRPIQYAKTTTPNTNYTHDPRPTPKTKTFVILSGLVWSCLACPPWLLFSVLSYLLGSCLSASPSPPVLSRQEWQMSCVLSSPNPFLSWLHKNPFWRERELEMWPIRTNAFRFATHALRILRCAKKMRFLSIKTCSGANRNLFCALLHYGAFADSVTKKSTISSWCAPTSTLTED